MLITIFRFVYLGHYDKCIAQLISKTKDMSAVAGSIFSHLAVQNKNLLVTMLIVRQHSLLYTHQFSLLDTVNSTECDPIFRITTRWVSDSLSPLSETDDVVHIK